MNHLHHLLTRHRRPSDQPVLTISDCHIVGAESIYDLKVSLNGQPVSLRIENCVIENADYAGVVVITSRHAA